MVNRPVYLFDVNNSQLLGVKGIFSDELRKILFFTFEDGCDSHSGLMESDLNSIMERYKGYKKKVVEQDTNIFTDFFNVTDVTFSDFLDDCMEDRIDINFNE